MSRSGVPNIGVLAFADPYVPYAVRDADGKPVFVPLYEANGEWVHGSPGQIASSGLWQGVREAGGQATLRTGPGGYPQGGVVLVREWLADYVPPECASTQLFYYGSELDALLLKAWRVEELAGLLIAALRLNLPTVVAPYGGRPFDIVPYALGLAPLDKEPVKVAVEVAQAGGPRPRDLVDSFSLANALRAGLSAGAGPELFVHLAAIAREAGVVGFPQMMRVLGSESPEIFAPPDAPALLAALGDTIHDTETVTGRLKERLSERALGSPYEVPFPQSRLAFVRGRASGTGAVCRVSGAATEVSGECRVFSSEDEAVQALESGDISGGHLLVVAGCGPRGGPGLLRLDRLGFALEVAGLAEEVPVLTDGLPPAGAAGSWVSLFSPEAALGGVIGLLRDGDTLRFDLVEGRIRTGVSADDLASREPFAVPARPPFGYAARYARTALPALEGAGFG